MVNPFTFPGLRVVEVTEKQIQQAGGRLDAGCYVLSIKPSAVFEVKQLSSLVSSCYYPGRFKRNYGLTGNGFIGSSEMLDVFPEPVKFMPFDNEVSVREGQILLSRSGTIGKATIVGRTLSKFLVSEHAIRMDVDEKSRGYVYAFLRTAKGRQLVESGTHGAVVAQIEPNHVLEVEIPIADPSIADPINEAILKSFGLRDESNDLMALARKKLLESLGLPSIDELRKKRAGEFSQNFGVVNFEVSLGDRMDASHYVPISTVIEQLLPKHAPEVSTIGDVQVSKSVFLPGRFTRNYVEEGFGVPFIGGGEIGNLDPRSGKFLSTTTHGARISDQLLVTENQILITRSGTIGRCNIVPKHWDGWAMSEHMIRIQPTTPSMAGYIYAWLSTEYGRELVRRFTYGAVIDEIDADHVAHVAIPLLAEHEIREIGALVLDANEKRHQAFLLEEQAIKDFDAKVWGD